MSFLKNLYQSAIGWRTYAFLWSINIAFTCIVFYRMIHGVFDPIIHIGGFYLLTNGLWWVRKFKPSEANFGSASVKFQQSANREKKADTITGETIDSLREKSDADSIAFEETEAVDDV